MADARHQRLRAVQKRAFREADTPPTRPGFLFRAGTGARFEHRGIWYMYLDTVVYTRIFARVTPNKIMYSVRLDELHTRLLKRVKARDGVSESEQIRRALMIWFKQKGVLTSRRKA